MPAETTFVEQLDQLLAEGLAELAATQDAQAVEAWRVRYLGSKGRLKAAMAGMKEVPPSDKPAAGKKANEVKQGLEAAFKQAGAGGGSAPSQSGPKLDITEPGVIHAGSVGGRHIITRVRDELVEVCARLGFAVADGRELEDDEHNFIKLNIPPEHPARDPIDNFYVDDPDEASAKGVPPRMLRSQTSTVQIRVMEDAVKEGWGPPIKVVSPGRVYRPDTVDATHSFMFHQLEALWIDRDITMSHLKTTLFQFARAYFGPDAEIRLRPSYFPFTEPSAEFDMKISLRPDQPPDWIELGGCGMVDPAVLEACGIDPEEWTGFAWGMGIERLAMGKYGIPDIRWLFENDLRFLEQL
ncbi:MAG: phenylalanine--tRNA ligase subunit alpha [Planctomycetota bacterium]